MKVHNKHIHYSKVTYQTPGVLCLAPSQNHCVLCALFAQLSCTRSCTKMCLTWMRRNWELQLRCFEVGPKRTETVPLLEVRMQTLIAFPRKCPKLHLKGGMGLKTKYPVNGNWSLKKGVGGTSLLGVFWASMWNICGHPPMSWYWARVWAYCGKSSVLFLGLGSDVCLSSNLSHGYSQLALSMAPSYWTNHE